MMPNSSTDHCVHLPYGALIAKLSGALMIEMWNLLTSSSGHHSVVSSLKPLVSPLSEHMHLRSCFREFVFPPYFLSFFIFSPISTMLNKYQ